MADGEEQVTSVEQTEASPVAEPPSEQEAAPAEVPSSETDAAAQVEEPTEPDAETQKQLADLDAFLKTELPEPEAAQVTDDEKVTLSKKDLDAQLFRERQSAADRATRVAQEQAEERDRQYAMRAQMENEMHARIQERAQGILAAGGELPPNFGDTIATDYKRTFYSEGYGHAADKFARAAFKALDQLGNLREAPPDVLEPLERKGRDEGEVMGAVLESAYRLGKHSLQAEFDKRVESESNKKAEVKASVLMKKFLAEGRRNNSHPEAPEGLAGATSVTREQLRKMTPEQINSLPEGVVEKALAG